MNANSATIAPLLLSSREAAKALCISERTLFSLRKNGEVKAVVIGIGGVRYSVTELQRFIAEREAAASPSSSAQAAAAS